MPSALSALTDLSAYKEIAFFPTLGQSTIHTLTHLPSQSSIDAGDDPKYRKCDILVASLLPSVENSSPSRCCNLYSFESSRNRLVPSVKPFDFVYLPVADIVCLNGFYDDHSKHYIVSLGLVKEDGSCFFNIYASSSLAYLPQRCISLSELDHFPIQTVHTFFKSPGSDALQWAFLLSTSGSLPSAVDLNQKVGLSHPVHVYTRLKDAAHLEGADDAARNRPQFYVYDSSTPPNSGDESQHHKPQPPPASSSFVNSVFGAIDNDSACILFPELQHVPQKVVTFMEFMLMGDDEKRYRLSAFGTLDGWIGVGLVDLDGPELKAFSSTTHDSTITKLKFFRQFDQNSKSPKDMALLVCCGIEPAVVYRQPFSDQIGDRLSPTSRIELPHSADFDHVNCACAADLDFDGMPEIVVGTFGQQLLFYKWLGDPGKGSYVLAHRRKMVGAIHSMECGENYDFLGDGTHCLAVLTSLGLHVFQCSEMLDSLVDLIAERLASLPPDSTCP